ncbi:MAG: preprotein translocase subunit SecE [Lachnospiraceae bacterium]|nr:preprotein translocase subunit SecE [Lachnospiraceae bacterium]
MSKNSETSSPTLKRSWFQELKAEFHKVEWPKKEDVKKQTIVTLIVAILLGALIVGVDYGWELVMKLIVG